VAAVGRANLVGAAIAFLAILVPAAAASAAEGEPGSCLACHATDARAECAAPPSARLDAALWLASPHKDSCLGCHPDRERVPHEGKAARVDCAQCHDEAAAKFAKSVHGEVLAKSPAAADAPTCASCHGTHAILPPGDARSSVHKRNLPDTCGRCHGKETPRGGRGVGATVGDYRTSVHGVAVLQKGNLKAASCSDCHAAHELRPRRDPKSAIFKMNIPDGCGRCHPAERAAYGKGSHARALARGDMDAPACNDCHTEHSVRAPGDPESTVYSLTVAKTTCPSCHNVERLARKHGLPPDRVATYRDSYHGLADRQGSKAAANCGSCHGVHEILPASDPASKVNPANLLATCSQCHADAGPGFVEGAVHAAPDKVKAKAAYAVRLFYWILIPLVVGGMLAHNLVLFGRFVREKHRRRRSERLLVRFRGYEVALHAALAVSFIVLAVTGFALTYPEAAWVEVLRACGMSEGVRAFVHRAAAVVLVVTALLHVATTAFSARGRESLRAMLPRPRRDLREAAATLAFHLGIRKERPRFDRFDYTMKMEYWALAWGTLLMVVTGAALWFKVGATGLVPRWVVYVAERVHFYEAILAVLAIVVWHLFFTMVHPDEYPMSLTWLDGRITEEEMKHAHPEEYERLKGAGREVVAADGVPESPAAPVAAEPGPKEPATTA
jgi:cytochrome b subunit of formate dehydrogenase